MSGGNEELKVLIITVAGTSSRFRESLGKDCLKCIYYKNSIKESLLYRMIYQNTEFDCYVIVGGFMYDELKYVIENDFSELKKKIILVKNNYFAEYGSGYSLYLGLKAIINMNFSEVVFAEGDLYVDKESFEQLYELKTNVITCNDEAILANKAVAFYYDIDYGIHYIYDVSHNVLEIREPFTGIFNSGQIWKFVSADKLKEDFFHLNEVEWQGTNLAFIQKYFGSLKKEEYTMIRFKKWINCNTISDFEKIK